MSFGPMKVARLLLVALALAAATAGAARAGHGHGHGHDDGRLELRFLGQQIIPTATQFQGTQFGGLSSITYDKRRHVFYALSDDQTNVRFYTLRVDVSAGAPAVQILAVTTLRDATGQPFAPLSVDPEGMTITSEGFANRLIDPWVREFALDGRQLRPLPVPSPFLTVADGTRGVRLNLGFESAGATPNGRYVFTGTEAALVQDGPPATLTNGSPARLLRYDLKRGTLDKQYVYMTDPIREPPVPSTQFAVSGLVELLPLKTDELLSMERSFSVGAPDTGNTIKLFVTELRKDGTTSKTLLLNLDTLGIPLDNVEGMAFGPRLRGGKRTLLLVSDNNFAATQFTQFLLFAVGSGHGK
jgi:hypothetical protein